MRKFHHIQVLRAIAASLVILDHALGSLINYGGVADGYAPLFRHFGGAGVAVFFVISGFIMMHMSYDDIGSPQAARTFIRRRIIRIVPAYWLATFASFAFFLVTAVDVPTGGVARGGQIAETCDFAWNVGSDSYVERSDRQEGFHEI